MTASFYRARQVWEQHKHALLLLPGVIGGGVGMHWQQGAGFCVHLYLKERHPDVDYPAVLDGVPVEQEEVGEVVAC